MIKLCFKILKTIMIIVKCGEYGSSGEIWFFALELNEIIK